MRNKLKELPFPLKIAFIIVLLVIFAKGLWTYLLYQESREHDRLPLILTDGIKMTVVDSSLYQDSQYANGDNCTPDQLEVMFKYVTEPSGKTYGKADPYPRCLRYSVEKGVFYWLEPRPGFEYVIYEKPSGGRLLVIHDNGLYGKDRNDIGGPNGSYYPGISSFDMLGNRKNVIFVYTGWNNPEKIIKLSIN
ncbi:hypothetical protein HYT74_04355 [Candidatus Daviesbacteria bacterium]|nr:hypothetical protein [Candidatus Daviesbacteria bacterium]